MASIEKKIINFWIENKKGYIETLDLTSKEKKLLSKAGYQEEATNIFSK